MSRTPANITQADIARTIRAAKQAGAPSVDIRYPDGTCEFVDLQEPRELSFADLLKRPEGHVYVVGFADYIKIGWSLNVKARMRELQLNLPEELKLITSYHAQSALERALHKKFAEHRSRGEWFKREGTLAQWIEVGCPL